MPQSASRQSPPESPSSPEIDNRSKLPSGGQNLASNPEIRSLDRRRSHRSCRLAAGVADDAAERDRRAAGHHRSRDGRPFVGYTANAAIGVSWQIILVVIVFISSLFTGIIFINSSFIFSSPGGWSLVPEIG